MAPHLGEELWQVHGGKTTLAYETWPKYDEALAKDDLITVAIQVNGKLRGTIDVEPTIDQAAAIALAKEQEGVQKFLVGTIVKEIYVPGKIVNFVVKG
jgi:leucyl-tRNA synthetase